MAERKIGVFGGSFNPVHNGHIHAAQFALESLGLSEILFLPSNIPPHKRADDEGIKTEDRLQMLAAALSDKKDFSVCDIEIKRGGTSYTIDTLQELIKRYPNDRLYFIIGSDMLLYFETWKDSEEIFKLCTLVAMTRLHQDKNAVLKHRDYLMQKYAAKIIVIDNEVEEISSTQVREQVRRGEKISELVPEMVEQYIKENEVYQNKIGQMEQQVKSLLTSKRFLHVQGTVKAAKELAKRYSQNIEKAEIAALLHDVTKDIAEDGQRKLIEKYALCLDEWEKKEKKLHHAVTGTTVAKHEFGVDDEEILQAIRYHTTGRANMETLEKIIYLADMIEENRHFAGVEQLRNLAKEDLDSAVLEALLYSKKSVEARNLTMHPNTKNAIDSLTHRRWAYGKNTKEK